MFSRAVPNLKSHDRITRLALRVLEDAAAAAAAGTVERTWGHRLALEYLRTIGVAQAWQATAFWNALVGPISDPDRADNFHFYVSSVTLTGLLDNWHHALGLARPDDYQISHWTRRYAAEMVESREGPPDFWGMCNRYQRGETHHIIQRFDAEVLRAFNDGPLTVHPRDVAPVVRLHEGKRVIEQMSWGFPVVLTGKRGQKLKPKPVNNARFDKLDKFWSRWSNDPMHRCLIPAAGYAEAVGRPGTMTTTWLWPHDQPLFAWAGLWCDDPEWGRVYTGVMTENAPELLHVHDRSPVLLDPEHWDMWLNAPLADVGHFDQPLAAARVKVEATQDPWWRPKGS